MIVIKCLSRTPNLRVWPIRRGKEELRGGNGKSKMSDDCMVMQIYIFPLPCVHQTMDMYKQIIYSYIIKK